MSASRRLNPPRSQRSMSLPGSAPCGADHQWRRVPPGQLSIGSGLASGLAG